ncbi:hypothetical protein ACFLXI_05805 [Chloroflexota bacterium]
MNKQNNNGNPLSSAEPWNLVADGYAAELMDWAEFLAGKAQQLVRLIFPRQWLLICYDGRRKLV